MCFGSYVTCLYNREDDQTRADEMCGTHRALNAENKLMKIIITKGEDKTLLAINTQRIALKSRIK
jgi:hypothetical protein